jgi:hypothetical protein
MSGRRQISPTGSAEAVACFGADVFAVGFAEPVILDGAVLDPFGIPLAMLLAGLEGIGPPTRVQLSPPHRKPSRQP